MPNPRFTLATYNINWGNPDLPAAVRTIRAASADVVCLQETTRESEAYLRRHLGSEYSQVDFQGEDGEYLAERFGILSRLPICNCFYLRREHGLFGAWILDVRMDDQTVRLVNVHLTPFELAPPPGTGTIWTAMSSMEAIHEKEIVRIWEHVSADAPTIVLGDFNSASWMAAPTFPGEHGFADSFASVNDLPDSCPTWQWFVGDVELTGRLDYIFHSSHFRTVDSRVIENHASDHFLLVSTLELSSDEPPPRSD